MSQALAGTIAGMATTQALFREAFCARVQELREASGLSQAEMATTLGIPLDRYKKYETRTPLPPHLIEPFSLIVRREIEYVLTGKSRRRPLVPQAPQTAAAPKRGRR